MVSSQRIRFRFFLHVNVSYENDTIFLFLSENERLLSVGYTPLYHCIPEVFSV